MNTPTGPVEPEKQCAQCFRYHPRTDEFFFIRDGHTDPMCKMCRKARLRKLPLSQREGFDAALTVDPMQVLRRLPLIEYVWRSR